MSSLLPIGTVFKQKQETPLTFMIIGYCPINTQDDSMYDYLTVIYPQGVISENSVLMINHEEIGEVLYWGYLNSEVDGLLKKLGETVLGY